MDGEEAKREVERLGELADVARHELQAASRLTLTEETSTWEALCEAIVPSFSRPVLVAAGFTAADVEALIGARDRAAAALESGRLDATDHVLDEDDFVRLDRHRRATAQRLDEVRVRIKALRREPGLLDRLEEQLKGKTIRGSADALNEHNQLVKDAAALEAEGNRVANISARHRKAKIRLTEFDQQLRALDAEAVESARKLYAARVAQLSPYEDKVETDPIAAAWLQRLRGLRAKQALFDRLGEELALVQPNLEKLQLRATSTVPIVVAYTLPYDLSTAGPLIVAALERIRSSVATIAPFDAYTDVRAHSLGGWWDAMGFVTGPPLPVFAAAPDDVTAVVLPPTASHTGVLTVPARAPVIATDARNIFGRGQRIGRYVVEGLIGKGGMAEVYLARQEGHAQFEKRVVLKRMSHDLRGHADLDRMFAREAQIAAKLQHPNLVQIYDYQCVDDEVFIVMEYLEGLPLQKLATPLRATGTPLSVGLALRCIADAARGLHAAHASRDDEGKSLGLVHRDISPDNLFLTTSGFTKVLDFGIAKRDDLTTLTGKNELKGKIPYMSPEQIQSDDLDGRADLFSLGATLFWLLVGQRPFGGTNEVATLHAVLTKTPPRLGDHRNDVSPEVQALIDALLEKRRDDRPANAGVVARRCEEIGAVNHDEAAEVLASVY
jgi:tRNA A-37 threonylcarbamoyl transferase component Bud32